MTCKNEEEKAPSPLGQLFTFSSIWSTTEKNKILFDWNNPGQGIKNATKFPESRMVHKLIFPKPTQIYSFSKAISILDTERMEIFQNSFLSSPNLCAIHYFLLSIFQPRVPFLHGRVNHEGVPNHRGK